MCARARSSSAMLRGRASTKRFSSWSWTFLTLAGSTPGAGMLKSSIEWTSLYGISIRASSARRCLPVPGPNKARERAERGQHFVVGQRSVAAARVRKNEDACSLDRFPAQAGEDAARPLAPGRPRIPARPPRKKRPVDRDADQGDDPGPVPADLREQRAPSGEVFVPMQLVDATRRPRHEVRDPEAPLRKTAVILPADRPRHQTRFVEQPPEPVREPCEVVADGGRSDPRVDADEQDSQTRADPVGEGNRSPGGRHAVSPGR